MVTERIGRKDGYTRKFLAIVDDTPECERAVFYAASRAAHTGGSLVLLYIIEQGGFQHWLGVEEVMRAEAHEQAEAAFTKFTALARDRCQIEAERVIREGDAVDAIHQLTEDDQEIAILVLAAGSAKEGPGPLVSSIAGGSAAFPIPVTVVPANLSDEDIAALS
ncbi:MAG: universal stress protein [Pseudomonadota bacterium]